MFDIKGAFGEIGAVLKNNVFKKINMYIERNQVMLLLAFG